MKQLRCLAMPLLWVTALLLCLPILADQLFASEILGQDRDELPFFVRVTDDHGARIERVDVMMGPTPGLRGTMDVNIDIQMQVPTAEKDVPTVEAWVPKGASLATFRHGTEPLGNGTVTEPDIQYDYGDPTAEAGFVPVAEQIGVGGGSGRFALNLELIYRIPTPIWARQSVDTVEVRSTWDPALSPDMPFSEKQSPPAQLSVCRSCISSSAVDPVSRNIDTVVLSRASVDEKFSAQYNVTDAFWKGMVSIPARAILSSVLLALLIPQVLKILSQKRDAGGDAVPAQPTVTVPVDVGPVTKKESGVASKKAAKNVHAGKDGGNEKPRKGKK